MKKREASRSRGRGPGREAPAGGRPGGRETRRPRSRDVRNDPGVGPKGKRDGEKRGASLGDTGTPSTHALWEPRGGGEREGSGPAPPWEPPRRSADVADVPCPPGPVRSPWRQLLSAPPPKAWEAPGRETLPFHFPLDSRHLARGSPQGRRPTSKSGDNE